jgi:hypothetical protein
MNLSPRVKNVLIVAYIIFVAFSFIYIRSINKYTKIEQVSETKDMDSDTSREAKVTLTINNTKSYTATLRTTDSVYELLEQLRNDGNFSYEKINYTYGTEVDIVNGEKAPEGYKWNFFVNGKDITFNILNVDLVDQQNYELNLVKQ